MRNQNKLVIFDCDGVLVDSEHLASQTLSTFLQTFNVTLSPEECREKFTGTSLKYVTEAVENTFNISLPYHFEELIRQQDQIVFQQHLKPINGVQNVLETISQPVCVASSGSLKKITTSLQLCGLFGLLHPYLFSASMVKNGKPAPDLFLHAANQMDFLSEDCIVIEDSPVGVLAAKRAGMKVYGFCGGSHCSPHHAELLKEQGADDIFNDMAWLKAQLS